MSAPTVKKGFTPKSRKARAVQLPGTRVSVNTSQPVVSTGIPSLDTLLGGGIPLGSLVILEEDKYGFYAEFFLKCFLAEGVTIGHEVFVASLDSEPEQLMKELPAPVVKKEAGHEVACSSSAEDNGMKIAWRYQQQKKVSSVNEGDPLGHHYDLKSTMPADLLEKTVKFAWGKSSLSKHTPDFKSCESYRELSNCIHTLLSRRQLFTTSKRTEPNVLRIAVKSLASFAWGDDPCVEPTDVDWTELTTTLVLLRAALRQSCSVAFITIPYHLCSHHALMSRISHHAHYILGLESFKGTDKEVHPLFKDYHGLFSVIANTAHNSAVQPHVDSKDWVFTLKRKKLCIEKLHLPPDLSESASRSQADPVKSGASMCGGGLPTNLDF